MTERPILFSAPMVRGLLNGSKTMTRRVVKPQPFAVQELSDGTWESSPDGGFDVGVKRLKCPYGLPGDRLWVRESFWECGRWEPDYGEPGSGDGAGKYWKAFGAWSFDADLCTPISGNIWRRIPSIHMPRRRSRILLEVVSTRIERLCAISEVDAIAEGALSVRSEEWDRKFFPAWKAACDMACSDGERPPLGPSPKRTFLALWESINGNGSWIANPWVWVVEFRRLKEVAQP